MVSNSAILSYRRSHKTSKCKKLQQKQCNKKSRCKYATGKRRSFCRKTRNHKRHKNNLQRTRTLTRSSSSKYRSSDNGIWKKVNSK